MIKKLFLKNFKCYKNEGFSFGKLTVFCGNNSVGKSTAIQAIAIPFQNKLSKLIAINGDLVNLGASSDIFSNYADVGDEVLEIEITFQNRSNHSFKWGVNDFQEQQELKNHLTLKSADVKGLQKLTSNYFHENGFQFIEAERYGPRYYFNINKNESILNWLGSKGEFSYEVFSSLEESNLRLPERDLRTHPEAADNTSIRRNIIYWMSEISPGFNIEADIVRSAGISHAHFQTSNSAKTIPLNMGFGLSYSLSIVIALLVTKPGGLVVLENPEAHLHPRGQSYLGRLIALAALSGVQVIIETHSDHLLNGIRVIARLKNEYKNNDFKVYYVSATDNGPSQVDEINIGDKGELSKWPDGFFDQQSYDIKTIIKGVDIKDKGEIK